MNWQAHIEQNPQVLGGKPCIKGTRVSVELILERLGAGWTEAEILASLPTIPAEAVKAAKLRADAAFENRISKAKP